MSEPPTAAWLNDAFISYSRHDRGFAVLLERALKAYRPPPGIGAAANAAPRHLAVFRDESDFTGTEYFAAIDAQLRGSRKLILLCSPAARASRFVDDEVRRFVQARSAADVVPLLLAGVPNNEAAPGQAAQMAFPQALCDALQMPLATSYLGFDAARDKVAKDRFEGAWYTLLANLFDVRRSEIEQRDRKRQARQRRLLGAVAGAVIVALSAALAFAIVSRNEAVAQRDLAEQRRRAAQARQLNVAADAAQAEGAEGARLALLLGIESLRADWTADGHAALLAHLDRVPRPAAALGTPHRAPVRALAVSADGAWVASESEAETVVWDRAAQREAHRLPPTGRGQRRTLAFSPDRRFLVASCQPAAGCVWDTATWAIAAPLQRAQMLQSAAFSVDGARLAAAARGSAEVQWFAVAGWQSLPGFGGERGGADERVSGVAFHPNGRWFAIQHQQQVGLWDLVGRREAVRFGGATTVAPTLAFSPDGRWLVTADAAGGLALWGLEADPNGAPRPVAEPNWQTPKIDPWTTPVFSRDASRLAFGLAGGGISVVSMAGRAETQRIAQPAQALAFDPNDAGTLIVGQRDGSVAAWPLDTAEASRLPHPGPAVRLALSGDGRFVAAIDRERIVRVFDRASRQRIAQLAFAEDDSQVDFSPDGRWLLLTSAHAVRVIDTAGWAEVLDHQGSDWLTGQVLLTPDGQWLLIAGGGRLHRYATGSWRAAPVLELQADAFFASPDGRHLAAHSQMSVSRGLGLTRPSMTRVWAIAAGGAPAAWRSHEQDDLKMSGIVGNLGRASGVSGDWTRAASGGDAALAQAAARWPRLRTLTDARAAPDTPWLASRDARGTALADAHLARAGRAHGGGAIASAFSADGRWLATSGPDDSLRLWSLETSALLAEACARSARNLTAEEWQRHFGREAYRRSCPGLPAAADAASAAPR